MNLLRFVYPLCLREKLFFHLVAPKARYPETADKGIGLEYAPTRIYRLLETDWGHRQIAWMGFYERELSKRVSRLARRGGVLVDVGANIGYFSILWAALKPDNLVYAFEPSSRNFKMLKENVAAQKNPNQIKVFDYGLSKESGEFQFDFGPDDQSGWGGLTRVASSRSTPVLVRRLDEVLPSSLVVDFLKIDTEGADTWVLYGSERLLREKRIRAGIYEENRSRMSALGIQPHEAQTFLEGMGYHIHDNGSMVWFSADQSISRGGTQHSAQP